MKLSKKDKALCEMVKAHYRIQATLKIEDEAGSKEANWPFDCLKGLEGKKLSDKVEKLVANILPKV